MFMKGSLKVNKENVDKKSKFDTKILFGVKNSFLNNFYFSQKQSSFKSKTVGQYCPARSINADFESCFTR